MPGMDGVEAARQILQEQARTRVLMLTTFDDEQYVLAALQAGACGYLLKDTPADELARAVRLAADGIDQFDPAATRRLAAAARRLGPDLPRDGDGELTRREVQVLQLIAAGSSNREIAGRLYLSEGTVKNHVSAILARLGLRDRTQAALYARERGWV